MSSLLACLFLPLASSAAPQSVVPADAPDLAARPAELSRSLADRVFFDEPGDGRIWALSPARFKASFDADGVAYHPTFGPLRQQPPAISMALERASVGSTELKLEHATPVHEGSIVSYDRGALVEYYELRPNAMEQRFRLDAFATPGELRLEVALRCALPAEETPAGLRFRGEEGSVTVSRAVVFDALGRNGAVETRWKPQEERMELVLPADFLASASYPVTIDPIVETWPIQESDAIDFVTPDVAYDPNTNRFAAVYAHDFSATDSDVMCALFTPEGDIVLGSTMWIDMTTACWKEPAIGDLRSATQFLIACTTSQDCEFTTTIRARTREAENNALGPVLLISSDGSYKKANPDVGGNSESSANGWYCIVYDQTWIGTSYTAYYQLVAYDGSTLFPYPQPLLDHDWINARLPSISPSCGRGPVGTRAWSVVWQVEEGGVDWDLYGRQIDAASGALLPQFVVDDSPEQDTRPSVSTILDGGAGSRPYLVAWQRQNGATRDVWGKVMVGDQVLVPSQSLTALEGNPLPFSDQNYPRVDSDGESFVVAYRESLPSGLAANTFLSSFRLAAGALRRKESRRSVGFSSEDQRWQSITAMHGPTGWTPLMLGRYLVAWEQDSASTGSPNVRGALFDEGGEPGSPYCFGDGSGTPCPCGNTSTGGAGCANSTGAGCRLTSSGTSRTGAGDLVFLASGMPPGRPGLLFQGNDALAGGAGLPFGDGLICAGAGIVRLQVLTANASGAAHSSIDVPDAGGASSGDVRRYQIWYRDPTPGACGSGFDFSNALEVRWRP